MRIFAFILLSIFLVPTIYIGGMPIRVEDLLFIGIVVFYPKIRIRNYRILLIWLLLVVLSNLITFTIQLFSGYSAVFQDVNTIFSLVRNVIIFYAGLKIGQEFKGSLNQIFLWASIPLLVSGIFSLIQFYDIGGIGKEAFLLFGRESAVRYGVSRTIGVVGNPNYAAFYQLCGAIGLVFITTKPNFFKNLLKWSCIVVLIWSVYVTFSRTGIMALLLIIIGYLIVQRKIGLSLFLLLMGLFSTPLFLTLIEGTRYSELLKSNSSELLTFNNRVDYIWHQKLQAFYDNPLWGMSASKGLTSGTIFEITIFDNSFLYLLVTSGLLGTILVLSFNIKVVSTFKKLGSRNTFAFIALLHINMLVFYLTTDLVKAIMFTSYYYLIIGVLLSYSSKSKLNHLHESSDIHSDIELE